LSTSLTTVLATYPSSFSCGKTSSSAAALRSGDRKIPRAMPPRAPTVTRTIIFLFIWTSSGAGRSGWMRGGGAARYGRGPSGIRIPGADFVPKGVHLIHQVFPRRFVFDHEVRMRELGLLGHLAVDAA